MIPFHESRWVWKGSDLVTGEAEGVKFKGKKCPGHNQWTAEHLKAPEDEQHRGKQHLVVPERVSYKERGEGIFTVQDEGNDGESHFKLAERRFGWDMGKEFLPVRVEGPCPEELWLLQPWKCPRPGWMKLKRKVGTQTEALPSHLDQFLHLNPLLANSRCLMRGKTLLRASTFGPRGRKTLP